MPPINELVLNPWFQFSGYVIGFVGFVITIVTVYLARKTKKIGYARRSFNLVRRNRRAVSSLAVSFNGKTVDALTITKLLIWNTGSEPIRDSDLPPKEKLRITTDGAAELLESDIIQTSSDSCNCRLLPLNPKEQFISFDFLDPNEGLVLQIAHTGTSGNALKVEGQIIGRGRISERNRNFVVLPFDRMLNIKSDRSSLGVSTSRRVFSGVSILMGLSMVSLPFFERFNQSLSSDKFDGAFRWIMVIGGFVYLVMGISIFRSAPPRGLEKYEDSFSKGEPAEGSP